MKYLLLAGMLVTLGVSTIPTELVEVTSKKLSPTQQLIRVQGSAVNFDISTFRAIDCSAYGHQFADVTPHLIDITDRKTLAQISLRLERLQAASAGYELDSRAKAVMCYSDHSQDTICLGRFTSYYRGHIVWTDTILTRLLSIKAY